MVILPEKKPIISIGLKIFRCQNPDLFLNLQLGLAKLLKILYFFFYNEKMNDLMLWLVMINKKKHSRNIPYNPMI